MFFFLTPCFSIQAALKKYQLENKNKGESLEKCQGELKKLRRKSQGSKNPSKYGDKEMQVSRILSFFLEDEITVYLFSFIHLYQQLVSYLIFFVHF